MKFGWHRIWTNREVLDMIVHSYGWYIFGVCLAKRHYVREGDKMELILAVALGGLIKFQKEE